MEKASRGGSGAPVCLRCGLYELALCRIFGGCLSRKQARDNAISMLKDASVDENADQSLLNEASQTLQVLAAYTVAESQIENLVTAKGYADCVAFMGAESISVVVDDADGLDAKDVARIVDIVVQETGYTPDQIKVMES